MKIRRAKTSDAAALRELSEHAFRTAYSWYNTPEDMELYVREHFSAATIEKELADPSLYYLLAFEADELIGYTKLDLQTEALRDCGERPLEIARLYTKPERIGGGIGKLLVDAVADYAMQNGFDCVCLGVWQKNEKAVKFYKREGFVITGTTTFVLGSDPQDDFIMVKRV